MGRDVYRFYAVKNRRVSFRGGFGGKEHRYIAPDRNHNAQAVIGGFGLIIFTQFLSKAVHLYSGNGIFTWVEARRAVQYVDCDIVFFDLIGFARKVLLTHVLQEIGETRRTGEKG